MQIYSTMINEFRGSVGGVTGSRNRYGSYLRARVVPVNRATSFQQEVRANLAQASGDWLNLLTPAQRLDWDAYAAQTPMTNRLGQTVYLTGHAHYVRSAAARLQMMPAFLLPISDGPTVFGKPTIAMPTSVTLTVATGNVSVVFDDEAEWCDLVGTAAVLALSRPLNVTRNYFRGPFRFLGGLYGSDADPAVSPTLFAAAYPFGSPALTSRVYYRWYLLDEIGRMSLPATGLCTLA